jgi:hypothetical protein
VSTSGTYYFYGSGTNSASVSANRSRINSDYASVGEQSAIRAGDGGFDVRVAGQTQLVGGQITSSQAAVDKGANHFSSAGGLQLRDIENQARFEADAVSATLGYSSQSSGSGSSSNDSSGGGKEGKTNASAGIGQASGQASSVTTAGISGVAGDKEARTGDAPTGLTPIFDPNKVRQDINDQVSITQQFGSQASEMVGRYAATKLKEAETQQTEGLRLQQQANAARQAGREDEANALQARADQALSTAQTLRELWGETGTGRLTLHALIGAITGGAGGAAGAVTSMLVSPQINQLAQDLDLPDILRQTLVLGTAALAGNAVSGPVGAVTGFNEAGNNYLTSTQELERDKAIAACKTTACVVGVKMKYGGTSTMQDLGIIVGVGGTAGHTAIELGVAGWELGKGIIGLITNWEQTYPGLKAVLSDPEFINKVGAAVAADYRQRLDMQYNAYNSGGWDGSVTAGLEAGRLALDIVGLATATMGAAKATVTVVKVGGPALADSMAGLSIRVAKAFDNLDAASQTKWLKESATWRSATTELFYLEQQAGNKSHFLLRHGDQVELSQLQQRAATGLTPDGIQGQIVHASRWLNNEDMLLAIRQAQAEFARTGQTKYVADMGRTVGDGYLNHSSTYAQTSHIQVRLNSQGNPITAFPVLAP